MARIADHYVDGENYKTKLCFCNDCTFAFYDYRMTDEEVNRLYADYRGVEYQKIRERYECWYTPRVNDALNDNHTALSEQKRIIEQIISKNVHKEIKTALDYGGNQGKTFTDLLGTQEKYVFDISGVPTIDGVKGISQYEELKKHSYDFIMCNHLFEHLTDPNEIMQRFREIGNSDTIFYIEVPSENPFTKSANKYSIKANISLLFNPNFNAFKLAKHYFKLKSGPFMPMGEHINFFTQKSIRTLAEKNGFRVLDIQENMERMALGHWTILSMLFDLGQRD